ncbi:hypothetical protein L6164_032918 [Bauhinia variegata]|uniref:Uncharacterized protein n=1 Tax=Bauhinia variegata TaxID=167791 RepID=A0ACB9KQZ5_BAUVA|nr:hypothetical protein L6164_032918 [Bauhinia variegata]
MTETIDAADPLILHHSDHPGMVLVSKPLEGYNYGQWSRAMRISLSAKNKVGFVNASMDPLRHQCPQIQNSTYGNDAMTWYCRGS